MKLGGEGPTGTCNESGSCKDRSRVPGCCKKKRLAPGAGGGEGEGQVGWGEKSSTSGKRVSPGHVRTKGSIRDGKSGIPDWPLLKEQYGQ